MASRSALASVPTAVAACASSCGATLAAAAAPLLVPSDPFAALDQRELWRVDPARGSLATAASPPDQTATDLSRSVLSEHPPSHPSAAPAARVSSAFVSPPLVAHIQSRVVVPPASTAFHPGSAGSRHPLAVRPGCGGYHRILTNDVARSFLRQISLTSSWPSQRSFSGCRAAGSTASIFPRSTAGIDPGSSASSSDRKDAGEEGGAAVSGLGGSSYRDVLSVAADDLAQSHESDDVYSEAREDVASDDSGVDASAQESSDVARSSDGGASAGGATEAGGAPAPAAGAHEFEAQLRKEREEALPLMTWQLYLHALMHVGPPVQAVQRVVRAMREMRAQGAQGVRASKDTFHVLLRTALARRDASAVLLFLTHMGDARVVPEAGSYSEAVALCAKERRMQAALQVVADMRRARMVPSPRAVSELLATCLHTRRSRDAITVLEVVKVCTGTGEGGVPLQGSGGVPLQGSGGVPLQGSVGVPLQGSGGVPLQGSVGVPLQGSVGVPLQGSVGVPLQGSVGVPLQGSVGVPLQGSVGAPVRCRRHMPADAALL
ncbi:unnamed protein product [Closterium sp. Yama58-4]|nr:unnamed protein product [Closterium sp. Yama58-4]